MTVVSTPTYASRPADDQDWKSKLFVQAFTPPVEEYARAHPEEAYVIFREGAAKAKPVDSANLLGMLVRLGNPHSLEALDVGMNDPNYVVQDTAVSLLQGIAFQEFPRKDAPADYTHGVGGPLNDGGKAYAAWKQRVAGKSIEEAITTEETELLRKMAQSPDAGERNASLVRLVAADFRSDTPYGRLRRKVANANHVLSILERLALPPNQANVYTLYGLELFQADEACLRRAVLPYAVEGKDTFLRSTAIGTLAARNSPMATEIITELIKKGLDADATALLFHPVTVSSDPRLIPIYIGALESGQDGVLATELEIKLAEMTGAKAIGRHDVPAWERWWKQNRDKYPDAVRNIPIPRLKQQPHKDHFVSSYPRRLVWREVDNDRMRGYWLVCPTRLVERKAEPGDARKSPGLIVVLPEDGDADKTAAFWLDVCDKALQDRCYIAIPAAPRFSSSQTVTWTTAKNQAQIAGATFTTERFVNEIVNDVDAEFGIERGTCFLFGAGASGLAAYACALAEKTPFRGFLLRNARFQSLQLPSLARAKGRRFYIQTSPADTYAPAWQGFAASAMLAKQGAAVKQMSIPGGHGYTFDGDPWQPFRAAVEWLETGK